MKTYLLKRQAELKAELKSFEAQVRDAELTDDQIKSINDKVANINSELQEITDALNGDKGSDDGSENPDQGDSTSSDDETEEKSDDPSEGEEDSKKEEKSKPLNPEQRSVIKKEILRGLNMNQNEERREGRAKTLFARMALGQAVDGSEARSLGIISGNGKVTVPTVIASDIISYAQEENPLRKFGSVHSDKATEGYPVLVKKPSANGHRDERTTANPIPDSAIELDEVLLDPTEFDALTTFTKKLANRSGLNIENAVITELSKVYVEKETDFMFNGLEEGNVNTGSLLKKAVDWKPKATIDLTDGGSVYDGIINFKNSVKKETRKNSMFMLNTAAESLIETMKDGQGRPLYRALDAVENGSLGIDGKLAGFNAHVTDYLYADKTKDDSIPAIYFGDFSFFHIQDVLGSMELQVLNELYSASNLIGVKLYNLLDGQLIYSPLEPTMYRMGLVAEETAPEA